MTPAAWVGAPGYITPLDSERETACLLAFPGKGDPKPVRNQSRIVIALLWTDATLTMQEAQGLLTRAAVAAEAGDWEQVNSLMERSRRLRHSAQIIVQLIAELSALPPSIPPW